MVLIDPFTRTVTPHKHDGNFQSIAPTLQDPGGNGSGYFTIARAPNGIDLYVDDEGLHQRWTVTEHQPDGTIIETHKPWPAFHFAGYGQALSGKCLVASADARGRTTDCPLDAESIAAMVRWGAKPAEPFMEVMSWEEGVKRGLVANW